MSGAPLFDPLRLAAILEETGVDALVAATAPNVLHLTRYRKGGAALAVVTRAAPERPVLIVPAADIDFVLEDRVEGGVVRAYGGFHRFTARGVELSERDALVWDVARAARADADGVQLAAEALRGAGVVASDVAGVPGEPRPELFRRLRMVKTEEEVGRLAEAARVAERAIVRTNEVVAAGVSQRDLARAFGAAVVERGARVRLDNVSLDGATALGNVNQPQDMVREGSLVRYDVGAIWEGYGSDLSRCFSFGEPAEKAARYHRALVAGQGAALAALHPGVRAGELFEIAVTVVRESGIPHYERTNVGHGIGVAGGGYDAPLLASGDRTEIEPGTVLCVETPYYELGFAGLQVEDMVVVTDDGYRPLSHLPRGLEVIP